MVNGQPRGAVTMIEVARAAGVALGTVSNVLNHPERVREELRERVMKAIADLGYVRNSAARTLAAGSSNTVGFVMVDIANSLYTDMARGAESIASAEGMYLVLANADIDLDKQAAYIDHFIQEQLLGILLTIYGDELDGARRIIRNGGRVVLLDLAHDIDLDACTVRVDYELSGYIAAQHLIEQGRRDLVFAGGDTAVPAVAERLRGAQRAVEEAGSVRLEHLASESLQADGGREVARRLDERERDALPDGIITAADLVAVGLMHDLLHRGIRFPDDIALIACDDNKSGYDNIVPLSTVDLPGYAMGREGMSLMLDEVRSPDEHVHKRVLLPPRLSERESSVGRRTP